jgi:Ca-activated chloride channel family protein
LAAEEAIMSLLRHVVLLVALALAALPSPARAWEPFRSESSDVARGNALMKKGDSAGALEAYETAARRLPNDPGVQLNRGLALLAQGKRGKAREAFQNATQGSAPADVRGEALYDIGLSFMQDADAAAKSEDLDGAQKSLREAVDSFKSSLRARPGDKNAAWNLELARRRLVEVEKKQEQKKKDEEEKKQEEEKKDEQQDDEDAGTPPDEQPDAGAGEQKDQGDEQKDDQGDQGDHGDQKKDDQGQPGDQGEKDEKKDGAGKDEPPKQPEPKPGEQKQPQQPSKGQQEQPAEGTPEQRMPEHMRKALDALEAGEENLEKHRAQMRARQGRRRIEKDW